jgi:hypothetical protein
MRIMTDTVSCSICGEPARAFRANADGTETPFCAQHIPNREPRRSTGRFRVHASSTDLARHDANRRQLRSRKPGKTPRRS